MANALLLPIIMEFNASAALDKYVEIAKAMKVYKEGMSQEEAARAAVDAVRALSVRVGIPQHLSEAISTSWLRLLLPMFVHRVILAR